MSIYTIKLEKIFKLVGPTSKWTSTGHESQYVIVIFKIMRPGLADATNHFLDSERCLVILFFEFIKDLKDLC